MLASIIASRLGLSQRPVGNVVELLQDGATIPFISRYRKEATEGMTEVEVTAISNALDELVELMKRRDYILQTIETQGKLTDELRQRITN